ncbi:hypothetical protein GCM10027188_02690 [Lysobacter humi (ex Lee et al. 2017)]
MIPAYRVRAHVLDVVAAIGPECQGIYVVDDACPEDSGSLVESRVDDTRVRVLRNARNQGVGGAVMTGYAAAIDDGFDVIVKLDGDGQMDPRLVPALVAPIVAGEADYVKGNRFFDLRHIGRMPAVRRFGNLALSFMSKASTGYWDIFDPTNGLTAIHAAVAARLPFDRISRRYFFETDMLFRLNTLRAAVLDMPMDALYGDEKSSLRVGQVMGEFLAKHVRNAGKRIAYNYFLRDLSFASIELVVGLGLLAFGAVFGALKWLESERLGVPASAGTAIIAALAVLSGLQFLLAFVAYDVAAVPRRPIHRRLARFSGAVRPTPVNSETSV